MCQLSSYVLSSGHLKVYLCFINGTYHIKYQIVMDEWMVKYLYQLSFAVIIKLIHLNEKHSIMCFKVFNLGKARQGLKHLDLAWRIHLRMVPLVVWQVSTGSWKQSSGCQLGPLILLFVNLSASPAENSSQ